MLTATASEILRRTKRTTFTVTEKEDAMYRNAANRLGLPLSDSIRHQLYDGTEHRDRGEPDALQIPGRPMLGRRSLGGGHHPC